MSTVSPFSAQRLKSSTDSNTSFAEDFLGSIQSGNWTELKELCEYLYPGALESGELFDFLKAMQASDYPQVNECFYDLIKKNELMAELSEEQMDELSTLGIANIVLSSIDLSQLSSNRLHSLKSQQTNSSEMGLKIQKAIEAKNQAREVQRGWCVTQ